MNEIRFDGQVVLVTGAGRGLGAAYARALAGRGASVIVHDAGVEPDGSGGDPAVAEHVAEEIGGVACVENLETEGGCIRTVDFALETFGRLDVLINNAGLVAREHLDVPTHSWERLRAVNVDAPFHLTRAAFGPMQEQGYGRLVFTTSGRAMSKERTRPGLAAYAVGKMAHFALMIVAAVEGEPNGILANAVAPAARTRMLTREVAPGELEPEQVAPGVVFLASNRCTVTGKVLEAGGGEFDVAWWAGSRDVDFGRDPVAPETIAERWAEIEGAVPV